VSHIDEILMFWFDSTDLTAAVPGEKQGMWWTGGSALDGEITARFGALHARASAGECDHWAESLPGRLALILLLDQLSRNIHRGTPAAFAQDTRARALTLAALDEGLERRLGLHQRTFLLMPLEHAEDRLIQERCVAEFSRLVQESPPEQAGTTTYLLSFAEKHRDIIARFGRFPHRNPILGRAHTADEAAWLEAGGENFGQTKSG
jgi:uncharacterized protein (DUF924 family)